MTLPSLPNQGAKNWYPWASAIHDAVQAGGASDEAVAALVADATSGTSAELRAAFGSLGPGYDIVILAGQSNMSGRGTPYSTTTDPVNPRIFQYKSKTPNANTIVPAAEPLDMHDTPTGIGPGLQFARWYAARALDPARKVLLVPVAHGGTPLVSNAALAWRRGVAGNLYANMISQAQGALAAAGTGARIVAMLWVQGETDGDANVTGAAYQTDFDALLNGIRTDLGVSDLPIVIGTMVPEYLTTGTRTQINGVHRSTPLRVARTDVAVGASGANMGDGNHYNAAGQRANGRAMYDAFERITQGLAPYTETYTPPSSSLALGVTNASPLGAYSLRKVVPVYAGNAVLVRRSTDSATQAIGFTGNDLDTAALLAFAGAGDAFVQTWYDQSGNSKHVTQATAAAQPKIVAAGAVLTSGGKPTVRFDGTDDILAIGSSLGLYAAGAGTVVQVVSAAQPAAQKRAWAESVSTASSPQYGLLQPDGSASARFPLAFPVVSSQIADSTVTPAPTKTAWNGAIHQMSAVDTGTTQSQWVDAAADLSAYAYARAAGWTLNTFAIGGVSRSGSTASFAMDMSELVVWPGALSTTDRQTAEASQKTYYGTP